MLQVWHHDTRCFCVWAKNHLCGSPGDHNSATSKEGSFSDLTSWFYLGSIDRCASSVAHNKWSTVLQGEISMICSAAAPPPALFTRLLQYASRIQIKKLLKLLDVINVAHKATTSRTLYLWELLVHNYLQICMISLWTFLTFFFHCLRFTPIYIIDFFPCVTMYNVTIELLQCLHDVFCLFVCFYCSFVLCPLEFWGLNLLKRKFWVTKQQTLHSTSCAWGWLLLLVSKQKYVLPLMHKLLGNLTFLKNSSFSDTLEVFFAKLIIAGNSLLQLYSWGKWEHHVERND